MPVSDAVSTAVWPPATRATVVARERGRDPGIRSASHLPRTPTELCTGPDHRPAPAATDRSERHRQSGVRTETPSLAEASPAPTCFGRQDREVAISPLMAAIRTESNHRSGVRGCLCVEADSARDERHETTVESMRFRAGCGVRALSRADRLR